MTNVAENERVKSKRPKNTESQLIFGGTFDPFHLGHLNLCKHIAGDLNVNKITLLPANIPPHKAAAKVCSQHRLAMLQALAQQVPLFRVDGRELNRDKPSYTVDTLEEIKLEKPSLSLSLLIGMDSLLSFTQWHQWQEILARVNLIVCTRPNYTLNIKQLHAELQQRLTDKASLNLADVGQIYLAPSANVDLSSTDIRYQLSQVNTYDSSSVTTSSQVPSQAFNQLPKVIAEYIKQHQLYC
ncbi:nicotinate-nucleotide adenylyltransferase [Thalassotalea euphylliae]|uniref:Probable nicotinate-nucleotide adenylyltransferase n=1 Tax=Thalassotalea euphylliae TaxID=1655234 RepID=A0A3E0TZQ9_9GAMM|nr:nicotinate-nucleotide adenylyltransferase [Thalassotalea euphylliae]REL30138.1 nicotinate-nucleotide adenylyltransferase [Thalassotalea euphylliae]